MFQPVKNTPVEERAIASLHYQIAFVGVLITIVFLITSIPYLLRELNCPPGYVFLDQLIWLTDQNMYFSFIRQGLEEHILALNRLTYLPHDRVFLNIEFLGIGKLMKLLALSEKGAYHVWRFCGIAIFMTGFAFLAYVTMPTRSRWKAVLLMISFGGGFGGFIVGVEYFLKQQGLTSDPLYHFTSMATLELRSGFSPFNQMLLNPHFSLPHGVFLLGMAFFLRAELGSHALKWYMVSGVIWLLEGFMRPYDLITIWAFGGAVLIAESFRTRKLIPDHLLQRSIPFLITAPVLVYHVIVFKFHPIFKAWGSQGHNISFLPMPLWLPFALGLPGLLALKRLKQIRSQPFTRGESLLLIWFTIVLGLIYIGRVIPALGFSPQLGVLLISPLVLFSFGYTPLPAYLQKQGRIRALLIAAIFIVFSSTTSIFQILHFSFGWPKELPGYYATSVEMSAWHWLKSRIIPGDIVLALPETSSHISKYTSAAAVAGHYSVTPNYISTVLKVKQFIQGKIEYDEALRTAMQFGVKWIYIGPAEKRSGGDWLDAMPWIRKVYTNGEVTIYKMEPA